MSPSDIEVLIHIYVCPEPHPRLSAPAVREGIAGFVRGGLVRTTDCAGSGYEVTEKGQAHIRQLCQLPFPDSAWVDSNGVII